MKKFLSALRLKKKGTKSNDHVITNDQYNNICSDVVKHLPFVSLKSASQSI